MKTSRKHIFKLLKALFLESFTLEEMKEVSQKANAGELMGIFIQALESAIESKTAENWQQENQAGLS